MAGSPERKEAAVKEAAPEVILASVRFLWIVESSMWISAAASRP